MKLRKRETGILILAVFCPFLVLYYFIVISPALSKQQTLMDYVSKKQADLQHMLALQKEWRAFQDMRKEAESILNRRGEGFTLLSYLEGISRAAGIDTKIQYIKPVSFPEAEGSMQPMGIEMRYDKLDIKELVDFLYKIEHTRNLLKIQRIKIQPVGTGQIRSLELTLQVNSYSLAK